MQIQSALLSRCTSCTWNSGLGKSEESGEGGRGTGQGWGTGRWHSQGRERVGVCRDWVAGLGPSWWASLKRMGNALFRISNTHPRVSFFTHGLGVSRCYGGRGSHESYLSKLNLFATHFWHHGNKLRWRSRLSRLFATRFCDHGKKRENKYFNLKKRREKK